MKLTDDNTALTHWTDPDTDAEWSIKILFSYQPAEGPDYEDGHMTYPGCDAGIVDMDIARKELVGLDVWDWVEFDGATDKEEDEWAIEIHEAINQKFIDDMGEE